MTSLSFSMSRQSAFRLFGVFRSPIASFRKPLSEVDMTPVLEPGPSRVLGMDLNVVDPPRRANFARHLLGLERFSKTLTNLLFLLYSSGLFFSRAASLRFGQSADPEIDMFPPGAL